MAAENGGWGAPCYTGGQCGTLLACEGDAGSVGGKRKIWREGLITFFYFAVTEGVCRPEGWTIGVGVVMFLFALLLLSLCSCFCYRLRRRGRKSRVESEGSLVMF